MSTILRALQKQKSEQSRNMAAFIEKDSTGLKWKVALLLAVLMILSLLAVVIYLLVKPLNEAHPSALFSEPATALQQTNEEALVTTPPIQGKPTIKINFDLQPLPQMQAEVQMEEPSAVVEEMADLNDQPLDSAVKEPLLVVTGDKPQAPAFTENIKGEIDYGETSADLQQRFANALLMSAIEDSEVTEPVLEGDGSDIRQLSRDFQEKVPVISYDSHIYSSVAKERLIRINGEDLKEGQFDSSGKIEVVEIQENRTIFRSGRQSFSLQSLTDWRGF